MTKFWGYKKQNFVKRYPAVYKEMKDQDIPTERRKGNAVAAEVPDTLKETKDAFILHCAIGCRVG